MVKQSNAGKQIKENYVVSVVSPRLITILKNARLYRVL